MAFSDFFSDEGLKGLAIKWIIVGIAVGLFVGFGGYIVGLVIGS